LDFPEMGRKFDGKEERFIVKDYYLIFYKVDKITDIEILHIWDSRRNPHDLNL
jgi:plasmid stabilization system protein ParE